MVSLDHLAALDLLQWLGTTERAAAQAFTNQSTISRRHRTTLETFGLQLLRSRDGLRLQGAKQLLALERRVHQCARFAGLQPLRVQVPFWSSNLLCKTLPDGWCANPALMGVVCQDPVALLRDRVVDACIVTPTQLPSATDDLLLLDLYRRPIEFTVFATASGLAASELGCGCLEPSLWQLQLLPFLPRSCRERSWQWFQALQPPAAAHHAQGEAVTPMPVAFLTPEMRQAQARPCCVSDAVDPYPYVERLAVLAENASEPALQRLQEHLLAQAAPLGAAL
jgi:hypothetical protein